MTATICAGPSDLHTASFTTTPRAWWPVVLSGGEGQRMRPLIERWLGVYRPKQYCTFVGTRSMFEHTLHRAAELAPTGQLMTIIGAGHSAYLRNELLSDFPGTLLEQPADRGTAPGIFLPLVHVLERDPEAVVIILPSDHFVHPEAQFVRYAARAAALAESLEDRIILAGAVPDRAETDYGWIEPGAPAAGTWAEKRPGVFTVAGFREKPNKADAERFYQRRWLWNTMMIAARAETLWEIAWEFLPHIMVRFESYRAVLRAVREGRVGAEHLSLALAHLYQGLETADFSKDLLQRAPGACAVMALDRLQWCDWGRPERVVETLTRLGSQPRFQQGELPKAAHIQTA